MFRDVFFSPAVHQSIEELLGDEIGSILNVSGSPLATSMKVRVVVEAAAVGGATAVVEVGAAIEASTVAKAALE
jgi:hypothetical protein